MQQGDLVTFNGTYYRLDFIGAGNADLEFNDVDQGGSCMVPNGSVLVCTNQFGSPLDPLMKKTIDSTGTIQDLPTTAYYNEAGTVSTSGGTKIISPPATQPPGANPGDVAGKTVTNPGNGTSGTGSSRQPGDPINAIRASSSLSIAIGDRWVAS